MEYYGRVMSSWELVVSLSICPFYRLGLCFGLPTLTCQTVRIVWPSYEPPQNSVNGPAGLQAAGTHHGAQPGQAARGPRLLVQSHRQPGQVLLSAAQYVVCHVPEQRQHGRGGGVD